MKSFNDPSIWRRSNPGNMHRWRNYPMIYNWCLITHVYTMNLVRAFIEWDRWFSSSLLLKRFCVWLGCTDITKYVHQWTKKSNEWSECTESRSRFTLEFIYSNLQCTSEDFAFHRLVRFDCIHLLEFRRKILYGFLHWIIGTSSRWTVRRMINHLL